MGGNVGAVTVRGLAYPWDVLGDPGFADRARGLGVDEVALAAAYHTVRAATPWHPRHLLVTARSAALYRRIDPAGWAGRRLVPVAATPADWSAEPDPFGVAVARLTGAAGAGFPVTAWVVLTHATRLGTAVPEVAVVNCVGERYPYALCPAREEVREYAATLATEAVKDVPVHGISLEACGQLGVGHGDHHDKTSGAWGPECARLLSICCCLACQRGWVARGLDPTEVMNVLRDEVRRLVLTDNASSGGSARSAERGRDGGGSAFAPDVADVVLGARQAATDLLRRQVVTAVRAERPELRVTVHGHPDPWQTGSSPGFSANLSEDAAAVVLPCWAPGEQAASAVRSARALLPPSVGIGACVTALPPVERAQVEPHVRGLRAAGMTELDLYHLGLVGPGRWEWLTAAVRAARQATVGYPME
jgi:hypothetical protein